MPHLPSPNPRCRREASLLTQGLSFRAFPPHWGHLAIWGHFCCPHGNKRQVGARTAAEQAIVHRSHPPECYVARTSVEPRGRGTLTSPVGTGCLSLSDLVNREWATWCWNGPTQLGHHSPSYNQADHRPGKLLSTDPLHDDLWRLCFLVGWGLVNLKVESSFFLKLSLVCHTKSR